MKADFKPCNLCGDKDVIEFLYRRRNYTICRCGNCGLVYVNDQPTRTELNEIYSAEFFRVGRKFSSDVCGPSVVNARKRLNALLALPKVGQTQWLDVGCAIGDFMTVAKECVDTVVGIEVSSFASSQARKRGLANVIEADFLEVNLEKEQFDLVSMWDVIEHVRDPTATFSKAFNALKPGGYLTLTTCNIESLFARCMGRRWHLMIPPRHLYFFSPTSIQTMLESMGFVLFSISKPGKHVPLDFVAWKLANLFAPFAERFVLRGAEVIGLGRLAPVINLGDIMTVIAQKPDR